MPGKSLRRPPFVREMLRQRHKPGSLAGGCQKRRRGGLSHCLHGRRFHKGGGVDQGRNFGTAARFMAKLLRKAFVRPHGRPASPSVSLRWGRHVGDPRGGGRRHQDDRALSPGSISRWGPVPNRGHRLYSDIAVLQRSNCVTILKNPSMADCRQCRRGHLTRCPRSADASLALCLQTFPTDVVVNEVHRQLACATTNQAADSVAA